ncbi:MAG: cyclase family protein [Actinobacteria bacterium]|nr:cyclase family protein [Actinomycetota bacterium]
MTGPYARDAAVAARPHEGAPDREPMGRRAFLRAGTVAAAGATVVGLGAATPAAATTAHNRHDDRHGRRHQHHRRRGVVDLTHRFTTDFPTFTGVQPTRTTATTIADDGFYSQNWTFAEHTATHVDAPGHFAAGQPLVDELDPDDLVAPLVVIDIRRRARRDPNAEVTVGDLRRYERRRGRIPRGALVCMWSGWARKADDASEFLGGPAFPEYNFPGFGVEAAMWLARRRDVAGIGVDTTSLDPGNSTSFAVHNEFLATGRYGVENLANLGRVRGRRRTAVVGVVPWQDGSGGPCRVLAL